MNKRQHLSSLRTRLGRLAVGGVVAVASASLPPPERPEEPWANPSIWLGPNPQNAIQLAERVWPSASQEINGIKLYVDWLRQAPDNELQKIAVLVRNHGLRVAVETGGLLNHDWQDQIAERSAAVELPPLRRWRALGGRLDVLELDDPIRRAMGFNRWGRDPRKRFTDYGAIARQLAEYLELVANEFRNVEFHLLVNFPNWGWRGGPDYFARGPNRQNFGDYYNALTAVLPITQATAPTFSVLTVDQPYDYRKTNPPFGLQTAPEIDWVGRMADLCAVARTNRMKCALIINSESGGQTSDRAFADQTLAYAHLIRRRGLRFEELIVQSWYPHPMEVVGDTLPAQMAVAAQTGRLFRKPPSMRGIGSRMSHNLP